MVYTIAICFPHLALEGELAVPVELPIKEFFHNELTGKRHLETCTVQYLTASKIILF